MTSWVEDIIQALENLGGQEHKREIINEVRRIRIEPIPIHLEETVQERIQAYSSDSAHLQNRGDYFKKIGNGIWARRDQAFLQKEIDQPSHLIPIRSLPSPALDGVVNDQGLVETIIQAVTNLGGYAHLTQIINEVRGLQTRHLGRNLNEIIQELMELNSSESNFIAEIVLFTNI